MQESRCPPAYPFCVEEGIRRTIQAIHASPFAGVLIATGTGSQAIAWLLRVPGASNTVWEAQVPYARAALVAFLGQEPAHFVSEETAVRMAEKAYARAESLRIASRPLFGLGCTGALATNRARRGPHRVHIALKTHPAWQPDPARLAVWSLDMTKGERCRDAEEDLCSRLVIHALALGCSVLPAFEIPLLPGEKVLSDGQLSPIYALLAGEVSRLLITPEGHILADAPFVGGLLSGAFHPLHEGHRQLAQVAAHLLGEPIAFELSLRNVDKPPLSEWEALRRARQFATWATLALTGAPTFREKARLFPGSTFVIGYDTAVRVLSPRYYAGEADMWNALREIRAQGCRFLVAGRLYQGTFQTLRDLPVPEEFRSLFAEIPESLFRLDISSTELRARSQTPPCADPKEERTAPWKRL